MTRIRPYTRPFTPTRDARRSAYPGRAVQGQVENVNGDTSRTVSVVAAGLADPQNALRFERAVGLFVHDGILTYSNRRRLIAYARTLGIRPFDANLLIASAQHRSDARPRVDTVELTSISPTPVPTTASTLPLPHLERRPVSPFALALAAVVTQVVIGATAWWLLM